MSIFCPVGSLVPKMPFVARTLLNFLSEALQNQFIGLKVAVDILSGLWSLAGLQCPPIWPQRDGVKACIRGVGLCSPRLPSLC